ncbi:flagellar biosynthetic protein FliO [Metabacillus herbersteinensis]|uniref:Flagellar protein n=1 Tax=Metabacillus herbersteinensis TaxID=283816 RepID=A0ABV6GCA7_9BACI
MLQRRLILLLFIISIFLAPPLSLTVKAEQSNGSVYELLNPDEEKKEETEEEPVPEDKPIEVEKNNESLSVTAGDMIKMVFALAFVLFLIYFLLKFVTKRNRLFQQFRYIENIGGTSLGPNKSVQMIKVGERVLVVGVGETIQLLKEIDDIDECEKILVEHERKHQQTIEPMDVFQKVSQQLLRKSPNVKSGSPSTFSTTFKEQLNNIKNERSEQFEDLKRKGLNKNE